MSNEVSLDIFVITTISRPRTETIRWSRLPEFVQTSNNAEVVWNGQVKQSITNDNKPKGWVDEQHVESDPVCAAFPEDVRDVMEIYSNLETEERQRFLRTARAFLEASTDGSDM